VIPGGCDATQRGEIERGQERWDLLLEALVTNVSRGESYIVSVSADGYLQCRRTYLVYCNNNVAACNMGKTLHRVTTRIAITRFFRCMWPCKTITFGLTSLKSCVRKIRRSGSQHLCSLPSLHKSLTPSSLVGPSCASVGASCTSIMASHHTSAWARFSTKLASLQIV
jgi:hypothetical protein